MRIVTKYAMLAFLAASFIALNNCGNQSGTTSEPGNGTEQNGPASDLAIYGASAPLGYQGVVAYPGIPEPLPVFPVETNCSNGVDDDGDGLKDCMDDDCQVWPRCSQFGPPLEELYDSRALTVYPNGIIVPEDVVFLKARGVDDDDGFGWLRTNFFPTTTTDCWVDPRRSNPYFNIPLGEALINGPDGAIGPQLFPDQAVAFWGPRAGLIDLCGFSTELLFHPMDDDNGGGGGRGNDHDRDSDHRHHER
ncbi:MAG TPA: hypothetical protein VEL47_06315 [Myxococcota bacterium]|nr:hypothetical protein [Myxococcota bacterium]